MADVTRRHRTLLARLVDEDGRSQAEIVTAWNLLAKNMREKVTLSQRQFDRWLAGRLNGLPRPAACRVSERFWGRPMRDLLDPLRPAVVAVDKPDEPARPATDLRTLVMSTANESGDHAASVARFVDPTSIDALQDRVSTAARTYATIPPFEAFTDLLRIRDLAYGLLDRTGQPDQERELFLLSSQACALLAGATFDLGYPHEANQHARAAHTYARLIGNNTAQAFARAIQCTLALWGGQPTRGLEFVEEGLSLRPRGTVAVRLNSVAARCWGLKGDHDKAKEFLEAAQAARGGPIDEMCDEVGGEFSFSPARTAFCAGATHLALEEGADAVAQASLALTLYAEAPPQDRWYGGEFGARADLVAAHVLADALDQAETEIEPLMAMPAEHRTERILLRARRLQHELAGHRYQGSVQATRLSSAVEGFIADAGRRALPAPGAA